LAVSSSTCKWLGSVALSGLLLASSLPTLASAQPSTTIIRTPMKPLLLVADSLSAESYTQTVRKQMQWVESPITNVSVESASIPEESVSIPSEPVAVVVAEKTTQPSNDAQTIKKVQTAKKVPEPVQVVAAVQGKVAVATEPPKQQVSRSSSPTLVSNALSLKGVPYVFGGTSKSGFDCSGYTQYVFKGSGISLPRTSQEQFNVGSSIKKDQLQTGDLVFFTTYAKGPSHVGIYIGGGNFVHASNSGVRTTSLSDGYYSSRYLGARRVN